MCITQVTQTPTLVYFIGIDGAVPKVHGLFHRASLGLEGCGGKLSGSGNA